MTSYEYYQRGQSERMNKIGEKTCQSPNPVSLLEASEKRGEKMSKQIVYKSDKVIKTVSDSDAIQYHHTVRKIYLFVILWTVVKTQTIENLWF